MVVKQAVQLSKVFSIMHLYMHVNASLNLTVLQVVAELFHTDCSSTGWYVDAKRILETCLLVEHSTICII